MILLCLSSAGLLSALIPLAIFARNLGAFRKLPRRTDARPLAPLSVLIPARNEADSIRGAVDSVLSNQGIEFELIVLDDASEDATAEIVTQIARGDARVRLLRAGALPAGWCGKQHACHQLSLAAAHDLLVWIDADVRLRPDALRRIALEMKEAPVSLLSGFPRKTTGTFLESLVIPLIHFILLGYCPVWMMRRSRFPGLGAGCGQMFIASKSDYRHAGGHASIRGSLHDGIALPRAMRRAGFLTAIFDATDVADCRMYPSASATWNGLLKNAAEGLATQRAIVPWTIILLSGQVLPYVLVGWILMTGQYRSLDDFHSRALILSLIAASAGLIIRFVSAWRFRQRVMIVLLHPVAVLALLIIQWQAAVMRIQRRPASWRGRTYFASEPIASKDRG